MGENNLFKMASMQFAPQLGEVEKNCKLMGEMLTQLSYSTDLVVFPECALCGYSFSSLEDGLKVAIKTSGPEIQLMIEWAQKLKTHILFGALENVQGKLFNSTFLVGPQGLLGHYQKTHLPFMGVDRFTTPGPGPLPIFEIGPARVGVLICYDFNFPEATRTLALRGADLIVVPTNWPQGCSILTDQMVPIRAYENTVFILAANRVGEEGTPEGPLQFIGKSTLAAPSGKILAQAKRDKEDILYNEIDLGQARQKRKVLIKGEYELDFIHDRRSDLYLPTDKA